MLLVTAEFKWECAFNPHFRMITKQTGKIDLDSKVFTPDVGAVLLWGRFSLKIRYLNDLKIPGAITHLTVTVDFQHLQVLR